MFPILTRGIKQNKPSFPIISYRTGLRRLVVSALVTLCVGSIN
ncbi:unnamed protein product [Acanthoscelides obtectus]|uniref:Uncharacterized protein n=1 Tax=Acanthoscelides obtectus TaxID=200917 RepID=A0A9P0PKA4_ACAOB|nr:unnamed protein product [Acanthoscelides obtectus]CAK1640523.1 hypothetical protein AOBTE_LOCUS11775 [Acanthoscelides obtectus]